MPIVRRQWASGGDDVAVFESLARSYAAMHARLARLEDDIDRLAAEVDDALAARVPPPPPWHDACCGLGHVSACDVLERMKLAVRNPKIGGASSVQPVFDRFEKAALCGRFTH